MCLAIPGKVVETYREHEVRMGKVDFDGIVKRVCLEHVPDAGLNDYVLVHVGFALSRIDESEAMRIFEFLGDMDQLGELTDPPEIAAENVTHPGNGDAIYPAASRSGRAQEPEDVGGPARHDRGGLIR